MRWVFLLGATMLGCMPPNAPGMVPVARRAHAPELDELARVTPAGGARALLVVHPREGCSGSAAMVFLDRHGTFYGSVAPGEAALIAIPADLPRLEMLSSVEVTAPLLTSFTSDEVTVPALPGGLLVRSRRVSGRECLSTGQYADARAATKEELEEVLGETDVLWLEARAPLGQQWLDRHRDRLAEIFSGHAERCGPPPAPSYCPEGNAPLDAFVR